MTELRTPGMNFSGFCLSPNTFMVWVTTMGILYVFSYATANSSAAAWG